VARGFSGDKGQLVPLIEGAIRHGGAAFIDVISPCVAFNNHEGSTRSYDHVRAHNEAVSRIDFIDLAKEVGLKASRRFPLFNGAIDCRLLTYDLYAGKRE
jgi:pyruvate/2-oxoacid:ferredoxin oxidoreductase beta subunit